MRIKLDEIKKDEDIYPRQNTSKKTIESYVEALKAGAKFPPVEVQRIKESEDIKTIALDGWHRLEAYREYNKLENIEPMKEVEVTFWKEEALNKEENLVDLMVRSAELNTKHGLRLSQGDAKSQLEKIADTKGSLNLVWKDIAESFGVTPEWASECVSPILTAKRMSRDAFMYKLSLLGWNNPEIGGLFKCSAENVRQRTSKLKEFNLLVASDFYDKHKSIEEIAKYYHLDIPLTWAILLGGKTDLERFELFGESEYSNEKPKIYDVWNFMVRDPRFSGDYPGFLFGQVLMNLFYYWTKQGDLIVDPMAGGGSTVDACLIMGRECRAYDIKPLESKKEIKQWDVRRGFPKKVKDCDFIFLDPPYFKKKEVDYNCPEIMVDKEAFISFIKKLADDCFETVKKGGYIALLYGNYIDYDDPICSIFASELSSLFIQVGFKFVMTIQTPLSGNAQYQAHDVTYAREHNRILTISRDLYIFKKVK